MLKKRLITAAILIPVFVALVLKLPPLGFAILITLCTLFGAWEWSALLGLKSFLPRLCYPVLIYGLVSNPLFTITALNAPVLQWLLLSTALFWLVALGLVWRYPQGSQIWGRSVLLRGIMGCFVLVPTWRALLYLRTADLFGANHGPYIILFIFIIVWVADSSAYFAGKQWGKTKLAPLVSPGKTWQGCAGALVGGALLTPVLAWLLPAAKPALPVLALLIITTVCFSILGDLFESMLKRNVGLKDSGGIFPGHGGLLDRVDSLTAAVPIFTLGSLLSLKILY